MRGRIVRVMGDKYFGFILGEDEQEYFFHHSALKNEKFNQSLKGKMVIFEESEGPKGLRAESIYVDDTE